jgi:hypothetical protein
MGYQIRFTENNNSNKRAITVDDKTINTETSLNLVGNNYPNYASYIGSDLLHILENFANPTSPPNPVQGQLWYDNVNNQLMVNSDATETNWISAGSVIKSASQPSTARSGDLWVDNIRQQLFLYTGTAWLLVGPQYSQDTLTGQVIETIYDNTDNLRGIISVYSENNRVAIISSETFTPKLAIPGFSTVHAGFTLINTDSDNTALTGQTLSTHRYYGTSTNSERLGGDLASSYVLATSNLVSFIGAVKASQISVGSDRNLSISDDPSSPDTTYLISTNTSTSKKIEVKMNSNTILSLSPNGRVGIGTKTPSTELDVNGTTTSNKLIVDGTNDVVYTGAQTASTQLSGGLYLAKSLLLGGNITVNSGTITLANSSTNVVITPKLTNVYDIGSSDARFRNIYSQFYYGNLEGNVIGNLAGNVSGDVSGNAGSLRTSATFNLIGDLTSNSIVYNGTQTSMVFTSILSDTSIASKPELAAIPNSNIIPTANTDKILVYRSQGEESATFTGYISGTTLHVVSVTSGEITVGATISGTGVLTATKILSGSGSVWIVNNLQLTGSLQSPISITARSKIFKTTKDTLLSDVPTVKPGSIILHSLHPVGDVKYPNGIPEGYLLCDGTEYYQSHYPDLFEALGAASAAGVTIDKFVVPNIEAPQSFGNMIVLAYIIYTGKI